MKKNKKDLSDVDLEFFQKKFIEALKIPKKFLTNKNKVMGLDKTKNEIAIHFDEPIEELDDYKTNSESYGISFVEMAIFNSFLHSLYDKESDKLTVTAYGSTDDIGRITFSGPFDHTRSWFFNCKIPNIDNEFIIQTKLYLENRTDISCFLNISCKKMMGHNELNEVFNNFKKLAFNNSEYKGKCIKIKLNESRFRGIEVIKINENKSLILNELQSKYINHFIDRVKRGNSVRYLLNGDPGTGKTESIREVMRNLMPDVTFIIPEFSNNDDLTTILEACEIFDKSVVIMDDIDLYLGSRSNGSYTRLLGEFLSFFDGVKTRKISLLASTNDKGLVDKAAERPGRFNMTLDYTFLTHEQIIKVCEVHLPKEYQIDVVYECLSGTINGKKAKITGAFISNLSDNIREMADGDENWSVDDTIELIRESYKGFYMSQVENNNNKIGFLNNDN